MCSAEDLMTVNLSLERLEKNWLVVRVTPNLSVQPYWVPSFLIKTNITYVHGICIVDDQRIYPESFKLGKEGFAYIIHALRNVNAPSNFKNATVLEKELACCNNLGGIVFAKFRWQLVEPNSKHHEYLLWHKEELFRRTAAFFDMSVSFELQAQELQHIAERELDSKCTQRTWQGTLFYTALRILLGDYSRSSLSMLKELCQNYNLVTSGIVTKFKDLQISELN